MSSDEWGNTSRNFWLEGKKERKMLKDSREKNNFIQRNERGFRVFWFYSVCLLVFCFLFLGARVEAGKNKEIPSKF